MKDELIALALRCENLGARLERIIENRDELSAGSVAVAMAMVVTLEMGLLNEAAAALRARASLS